MESHLMASGIGAWRNFDEIEESLILDELLLLNTSLSLIRHDEFKMLAAVQGIDVPDADDGNQGGEELPPELLEREREWKKKKEAHFKGEGDINMFEGFGLGHERI